MINEFKSAPQMQGTDTVNNKRAKHITNMKITPGTPHERTTQLHLNKHGAGARTHAHTHTHTHT
jgi:hypothetical protein